MISSSMSNIRRWLNEVPQTLTGSWPGPQTASGQLRRPRSASCPGEFPQWLPPTSSEHSANDTRSTESPTTHASDDQSAAGESNTTVVPARSDSLGSFSWNWPTWMPRQHGWGEPSFPSSSSSSSSDDSNNNPPHRPSPDPIPPQQPAHLLELSGRGDHHPYRDFRSPWRAWQRQRNEKEKYYGFRHVNRGQLIAAGNGRAIYRLAQQPPRPPKHHHRPAHRVYVESSQPAGKVYGKPSPRVDRRRKERKHRTAILKAEVDDLMLKTRKRRSG